MRKEKCVNCNYCIWDNGVDLYSCDEKEEYVKPDDICKEWIPRQPSDKVVKVEIRCAHCGAPATIGSDERGAFGWCPYEKKMFSVEFI